MSSKLEDDDESIRSLFNNIHPAYMSNLQEDDTFKRILMTADVSKSRYPTPRPPSAMRLGTATGFQRQGTAAMLKSSHKPGTGFRIGSAAVDVNRPMTAVRGAGYTSHGKVFDPLNEGSAISTPLLELQKDESPEEKLRLQEQKVMQLIEESFIASSEGDVRKALSKAKEASNKERSLVRMQDHGGQGDQHNIDLTYSVLFALATQYEANEQYTEALNTYQIITKSRSFSHSHRLKINMGNIYYKQGQYQQAVKMYRMALDQVSSSQRLLRVKIMHNIAQVFIGMSQWEEAIVSLEYIMTEQPKHRAGLHLVVCCRALEDTERMKNAFTMLLAVPLNPEDEEKYDPDQQETPEDVIIATAIKNDDLHVYEMQKLEDAKYCILTAAKLISPYIEDTFSAGYDWCVRAMKNSEYAGLAGDLEVSKAVMFLKQRQLPAAIETLKALVKEPTTAVNAATNLCFIYYLQGDYQNALKYGEIVKDSDGYNVSGFVNLGACVLSMGQLDQAKTYFLSALECDPSHFESLYNLGLVLKKQGNYDEALECFQKFSGSLALLPSVVYHTATLLELMGDSEAAADTYQQLLGLVPSDAAALQKLGELYDHDGDKQQAHHYHIDSFRYYPGNLSVIDWLGSYYIEMQVVEKALTYFEKAALMQPNEPKWKMMVAGCHRRSGNLQKALLLYQDIHRQFPENTECLRFLARLCSDLGMREGQEYTLELKKLEKARDVRERVASSRPGSRRSNSGLSSRGGSGLGSINEKQQHSPSPSANNRGLKSSRLLRLHSSAGSSDSGFGQTGVDAAYEDPLGPLPSRPRTGAGKALDFDDFTDEQLGDDLLPE